MSYCRMGSHSHVYVISLTGDHGQLQWACICCALRPHDPTASSWTVTDMPWTVTDTPAEMHAHLLAHRVASQAVPQQALDALAAEMMAPR